MIKKIILTLLLTIFVETSFAQQNLQDVEWTSSSTALPPLEDGKDGYHVSGDLAGRYNYFIAGAKTQEDAKDYYIKFGDFTNSVSSTPRIYLGETDATTPSYYGDITAVFDGKLTSGVFYAGSNTKVDTSFGNVKTTISGDVTFIGEVYGGSYIYKATASSSYKSITLDIENGTHQSNLYGTGYVKGTWSDYALIKISEGVSISITNAILSTSDKIVAGTNTQSHGHSIIEGGTYFYLGNGTKAENITSIIGGSYLTENSTSTITGGTSVVIDGATIGTATTQANIYGGSQIANSNHPPIDIIDTTKVSILSGSINANVYGGSSLANKWGKSTITGDTLVDMKGGEVTGNIYGGSLCTENYGPKDNYIFLNINGTSNVKISGGAITGDVFGGSNVNAVSYGNTRDSVIIGGTNIDITGGTINGTVYGGSRLSAKGSTNDSNTKDGAVNINISDGIITGDVVAGSYAIEGTSVGENFGATVSSAKIVISGGTIGGDIIASGIGSKSVISGNSEVVFISNSDNINFTGKVSGTSNNSQVLGETIVSFGDGETAYTGMFNGSIENIDTVVVESASDVAFENAFTVTSFIVQSDSKVILSDDTTFDTLTIAFNEELSENSSTGIYMTEIFGDSTSIVLSSIEDSNSFMALDSSGSKFEASLSDGVIEIGSAMVPEPSEWAVIFGTIALGFVVYSRRK